MANRTLLTGLGVTGSVGSGFDPNLAGTPISWFEIDGQSLTTSGQHATNNVEIAQVLSLRGGYGEMSQPTGSSQPLYITNQTSTGLAVARFDGINDFFDCTFSLGALRNIPSLSLIYVVKLNAINVQQTFFFGSRNVSGSARFLWRINESNAGVAFTRTLDSDTGGTNTTTGFTGATGTFYTFHVSIDFVNNILNAWVNGTQRITNANPTSVTAGNTSDTNGANQISIGRDAVGARYLSGDLVAWGAFSNVFTAQQVSDSLSAIQTYLGV